MHVCFRQITSIHYSYSLKPAPRGYVMERDWQRERQSRRRRESRELRARRNPEKLFKTPGEEYLGIRFLRANRANFIIPLDSLNISDRKTADRASRTQCGIMMILQRDGEFSASSLARGRLQLLTSSSARDEYKC